MSSNYNSRPRPAEVLVADNKYYIIRRKETYIDIVGGEVIPQIVNIKKKTTSIKEPVVPKPKAPKKIKKKVKVKAKIKPKTTEKVTKKIKSKTKPKTKKVKPGRAVKTKKKTRSEEHTSELQSHSFISYAVFCLKKKKKKEREKDSMTTQQ